MGRYSSLNQRRAIHQGRYTMLGRQRRRINWWHIHNDELEETDGQQHTSAVAPDEQTDNMPYAVSGTLVVQHRHKGDVTCVRLPVDMLVVAGGTAEARSLCEHQTLTMAGIALPLHMWWHTLAIARQEAG